MKKAILIVLMVLVPLVVSAQVIKHSLPSILSLLLDDTGCVNGRSQLQNLPMSSTLVIQCHYDLGGQTVLLPFGVNLQHKKGGVIYNGTLVFNAGSIDGDLLNVNLDVEGNAELNSPEFDFKPAHWQIRQGKVSDTVALRNQINIQKALDDTAFLGAEKFNLGTLDAYFKVDGWGPPKTHAELSINLPSNIHFAMSDDTHLRIQPSRLPFLQLISVFEKQNVTVTGGNLHGDRWTHDYSPINQPNTHPPRPRNTHEWEVLLLVAGSQNVIADNITMMDSTGDAFVAGAAGHRVLVSDPSTINPERLFNQNVTLKNSRVLRSRRNNISVTDGRDITIENNLIKDAGLGEPKRVNGKTVASVAGVAPRFGLDVEPYIEFFTDGTARMKFFEKVENVLIVGNTFENNEKGAIIEYSGINTTIKDNISDAPISASNSTGTKFINNTLTVNPVTKKFAGQCGISMGYRPLAGDNVRYQYAKNNVVDGNRVSGFNCGINVRGLDGKVSNNTITDFGLAGINFGFTQQAYDPRYGGHLGQPALPQGVAEIPAAKNIVIENNLIQSPRTTFAVGIRGASLPNSNMSAENILFDNNTINVLRSPVSFILFNNKLEQNGILKFTNSDFSSAQSYPLIVKNSSGLEFIGNRFINTRIQTEGSTVVDRDNVISN